jgi:hypothetical protein
VKYLYGDATESPLDRNYLEFLKAVLEFSVAVLAGVETVKELSRKGNQRQKYAAKELKQLDFVAKRLANALDDCSGIDTVPTTDKVVDAVRELALTEVKKAEQHVRGSLENELRKIEAAVRQHRADNVKRLEKLLLHHDLPESRQWVDVTMADDGSYGVSLIGSATSDVSWVMGLRVPDDHLLAEPLRIDRLFPDMSLKVPEMSGWISKSVKLKAHKLGKDYVTDLLHHKDKAVMRLRSSIQDRETGYDIAFLASGKALSVSRVQKGMGTEPYEPEPDDAATLAELFASVAASTTDLVHHRVHLASARLDDKALEDHTAPTVLIERLIAQMAPVVKEISNHSLSPAELVLKRVLADDRREEIFASKADLREMLAPLSDSAQQLFHPLDLGIKRKPAGEMVSERPSEPSALPPSIAPGPSKPVGPPPLDGTKPPLSEPVAAEPSPPSKPAPRAEPPKAAPSQPAASTPAVSTPAVSTPAVSTPAASVPGETLAAAKSPASERSGATTAEGSFTPRAPAIGEGASAGDAVVPAARKTTGKKRKSGAEKPPEEIAAKSQPGPLMFALAPPPVPRIEIAPVAHQDVTRAIPLSQLAEDAKRDAPASSPPARAGATIPGPTFPGEPPPSSASAAIDAAIEEVHADSVASPLPPAVALPKPSRPPKRRPPPGIPEPRGPRHTIQGPPPARPSRPHLDSIDVEVDETQND